MTHPVQPGQVIAGKYVIQRRLSQGGMGAIFVARQKQLNRQVAIKFLLPAAVADAEALARFEREAQAAAALQSDHVTHVYDVGHLETGEPYIVMELLKGEDLAKTLERRGPLPTAEAIAVIVQACDAIAEAHSLGIVHRDLKPANLFLAERPNGTATVKVLDFGISKAQLGSGATLTVSASLMGSPLYMSPEQVREFKNVDRRTDIWALGVTMYELITGQPPFAAKALGEICAQILTVDPAPPRSKRSDVPEQLEAIVMRCLHKEPSQRYGTVNELVNALRSVRIQSTPEALEALAAPLASDQLIGLLPSNPALIASTGGSQTSPRAGVETAQATASTQLRRSTPSASRKLGSVAIAAGAIVTLGAATMAARLIRSPAVKTSEPPLNASGPVPTLSPTPSPPSANPEAEPSPSSTFQPIPAALPSAEAAPAIATAPPSAAATARPAPAPVVRLGATPAPLANAPAAPVCRTVKWKDENDEIHFALKCR